MKFGQYFEADVWLRFWCSGMVEILKLNFDQLVIWLDEDTVMRELKNLTIKKVSHLELNKPSKHQIERPLFLKDCTIASVYFPPPFGPLIWWRSTPTEDLEPNISTMWRSVSSWIVESNPILILSSRSFFSTFIFKMLFAYPLSLFNKVEFRRGEHGNINKFLKFLFWRKAAKQHSLNFLCFLQPFSISNLGHRGIAD